MRINICINLCFLIIQFIIIIKNTDENISHGKYGNSSRIEYNLLKKYIFIKHVTEMEILYIRIY